MSVHLEALADEVFSAADAQARPAVRVERFPFGEVRRSPDYPDLFFLNGITQLRAPDWSAEDLERVLAEKLPGVASARVSSRDPQTIARLGPLLSEAGYQAECRVAMIEVAASEQPRPGIVVRPLETADDWRAFEGLVRGDAAEHGWTQARSDQLVRLYLDGEKLAQQSWLLAFIDGQAVGYVGLYQHRTVGYLHALYTPGPARGRGVGSALVVGTSGSARALGCERLTLQCTRDSFLPGFYHRLGFRVVGEMWIWSRPAIA